MPPVSFLAFFCLARANNSLTKWSLYEVNLIASSDAIFFCNSGSLLCNEGRFFLSIYNLPHLLKLYIFRCHFQVLHDNKFQFHAEFPGRVQNARHAVCGWQLSYGFAIIL
jgi:hypothetical protein